VQPQERRYKSITRVDSSRVHGWFVRVVHNGDTHPKLFSDGKHGGRAAALAAAVRWRNKTERAIGKPRTERIVVARKPGAGVRRTTKDGRLVYEVTWSPRPKKVSRTTFSIALYGERGARDLAHALRAEMDRRHYGYR
jgi:hypothetical protein